MEEDKDNSQDLAFLRKQMVGKSVIQQHDMPNDQLNECTDIIISGIEAFSAPTLNLELASKQIKENLDKKYGPFWHCMIGEGFAFDVTVQMKSLLFMYYNGTLACLIFKS